MTALNNKVYFILRDTSTPSQQLNIQQSAWSEVPAIPVLFDEFGLCLVEFTEKLYVYQLIDDTDALLELDLKTLTWRNINLPTAFTFSELIQLPGTRSMIFIDSFTIWKIDPEALTVCEVGEMNESKIVSCSVHEGSLIYHSHSMTGTQAFVQQLALA
mmetsp:Transcript_4122/g.8343  ORF Transcript_4122/g.8343 Transcript_4122/m.8343 type:complete len:158 (+) Transcript_4122:1-474(+)